ncbi:hypothetical protein ACFE04_020057 [Oxalis oulophora]
MSNITGEDGSFSSGNTGEEVQDNKQNHFSTSTPATSSQPALKKKRNLPGTPDPKAEVIALSPTTLMATNRFVCEICNKGFQRDQNLQLHRRGHNLPWKLRQRTSTEVKKRVYICPEPTCVHHNPARALGDLTGIKKHFSRKHGEKKWKCEKCSKKYAVQSDWKAHQKTCGTREYKCDCGTIFSRRDSFITHRAFCDALAEENNKVNQMNNNNNMGQTLLQSQMPELIMPSSIPSIGISDFNNTTFDPKNPLKSLSQELVPMPFKNINMGGGMFSTSSGTLFGGPRGTSSNSSSLQLSSSDGGGQILGSAHMSATALLQKAAQMGATASNSINSPMMQKSFNVSTMAGVPDHPIIRPPSYSAMQPLVQNNTPSYDRHIVGINAQDQMFDPNTDHMGMFSSMFMEGDQTSFMKNINEDEDSGSSSTMIMQNGLRASNVLTGQSRFVGANEDVMTRDFMGIGGSRSVNVNLHDHQLEAMRSLPNNTPFQHQKNGEPQVTDDEMYIFSSS